MAAQRCRYCQKVFQPSKYCRQQSVCSDRNCQRQRRTEYHRRKVATDPDYRQVCRDSSRKWRALHPDYWKQYRQKNPESAQCNSEKQKLRDQKRRLGRLANNTSALDLKLGPTEVYLVGSGLTHLANNNLGPVQLWIFEALPPRRGPIAASCKQHLSGATALPAG